MAVASLGNLPAASCSAPTPTGSSTSPRPSGQRAGGHRVPPWSISLNLYDLDNPSLSDTVVHEVAHQWWYAMVGNNQYLHAFLDESLSITSRSCTSS